MREQDKSASQEMENQNTNIMQSRFRRAGCQDRGPDGRFQRKGVQDRSPDRGRLSQVVRTEVPTEGVQENVSGQRSRRSCPRRAVRTEVPTECAPQGVSGQKSRQRPTKQVGQDSCPDRGCTGKGCQDRSPDKRCLSQVVRTEVPTEGAQERLSGQRSRQSVPRRGCQDRGPDR